MPTYQVINVRAEDGYHFYDVEFCFSNGLARCFCLIFATVADDSLAQQNLRQLLGDSLNIMQAKVISFYDTQWDAVPAGEWDGSRTVFDKIHPQQQLNPGETRYFFQGMISVIESFIRETHTPIIYFTAYSASHEKTYNRLLHRSKSQLLSRLVMKGGMYALQTRFYGSDN